MVAGPPRRDRDRQRLPEDRRGRRRGDLDEDNELKTSAGRWRNEKIVYERLEPADFARVEPALNPDLRVAYYLPDRAQIRNPRHLKALAKSLEGRGVPLRPGSAVEGFETSGSGSRRS